MSTAEFDLVREELIQWIQSMNDSKLLNLLNSIKLSAPKPEADWWNDLTEDQKENIRIGLDDLRSDTTLDSKEFWHKLRSGE